MIRGRQASGGLNFWFDHDSSTLGSKAFLFLSFPSSLILLGAAYRPIKSATLSCCSY